jgi:hypothetical protein
VLGTIAHVRPCDKLQKHSHLTTVSRKPSSVSSAAASVVASRAPSTISSSSVWSSRGAAPAPPLPSLPQTPGRFDRSEDVESFERNNPSVRSPETQVNEVEVALDVQHPPGGPGSSWGDPDGPWRNCLRITSWSECRRFLVRMSVVESPLSL